jgi:hypothetical protein
MGFLNLRDLGSIKEKLLDLFSGGSKNQRRIIFSTYLDITASQFFPDVRGVEMYCCPQVGNIDPYALEHLHQQGAIIYFVDGLHMNLYWVENQGAIIGSASLCLSRIPHREW